MPSKIFSKTQKIGPKTSSNSALTLPNSRCQRELMQNRISKKKLKNLKPNIIFDFITSNPRVWHLVNLKAISNNFATHMAPNTYDNKNKKLIISALMNTNIKLGKKK
jgi:hypothetical protein